RSSPPRRPRPQSAPEPHPPEQAALAFVDQPAPDAALAEGSGISAQAGGAEQLRGQRPRHQDSLSVSTSLASSATVMPKPSARVTTVVQVGFVHERSVALTVDMVSPARWANSSWLSS